MSGPRITARHMCPVCDGTDIPYCHAPNAQPMGNDWECPGSTVYTVSCCQPYSLTIEESPHGDHGPATADQITRLQLADHLATEHDLPIAPKALHISGPRYPEVPK